MYTAYLAGVFMDYKNKKDHKAGKKRLIRVNKKKGINLLYAASIAFLLLMTPLIVIQSQQRTQTQTQAAPACIDRKTEDACGTKGCEWIPLKCVGKEQKNDAECKRSGVGLRNESGCFFRVAGGAIRPALICRPQSGTGKCVQRATDPSKEKKSIGGSCTADSQCESGICGQHLTCASTRCSSWGNPTDCSSDKANKCEWSGGQGGNCIVKSSAAPPAASGSKPSTGTGTNNGTTTGGSNSGPVACSSTPSNDNQCANAGGTCVTDAALVGAKDGDKYGNGTVKTCLCSGGNNRRCVVPSGGGAPAGTGSGGVGAVDKADYCTDVGGKECNGNDVSLSNSGSCGVTRKCCRPEGSSRTGACNTSPASGSGSGTGSSSSDFDAKCYLDRYPDVAANPVYGKDPERHYNEHGKAEKRIPGCDSSPGAGGSIGKACPKEKGYSGGDIGPDSKPCPVIPDDAKGDLTIKLDGISTDPKTDPRNFVAKIYPDKDVAGKSGLAGAGQGVGGVPGDPAVKAAAAYTATGELKWDKVSGDFKNSEFKFPNVPDGEYQIVVQTDRYLDAQLVKSDGNKVIALGPGKTFAATATMYGGDAGPSVNPPPYGDNFVNLLDYNLVLGCLDDNAVGVCEDTDFNRDGKVDQKDVDIVVACSNDSTGDKCDGSDLNRDGKVDQKDVDVVKVCLGGVCKKNKELADLNDDGKVDKADLDIVSNNFGRVGFAFETAEFKCAPDPLCEAKGTSIQLCTLVCSRKQDRS